jgi:phosphoglycolate phosphatase-like HAD superfamily hydrolase
MPRSETLVVLDMDGVLLDLRVDVEALRAQIRRDLAAAGVDRECRPLLAAMDDATRELEGRDPAAAERLRSTVWSRVDAAEAVAAPNARVRPSARALLERLGGTAVALYTNNGEAAARAALAAAGIDAGVFLRIFARAGAGSLKPSGRPIVDAIRAAGGGIRRVFMIGDTTHDMAAVRDAAARLAGAAPEGAPELIAIGMRKEPAADAALERAGADFLCADLDEAAGLVLAEPFLGSLSIVLVAYDEEATIAGAIGDVRRYCRRYAPDYEIVVVDDGSADGTAAAAERADQGDVRLVRHASNRGMGAALRTGYRAASKAYLAHLPGDRQVRPQSLTPLLPLAGPRRVPLSRYATAPSGPVRAAMSVAFRGLVRVVGGLGVDFAGTYVLPRALLDEADPPDAVASPTFLYSFQLLEGLAHLGCDFPRRVIHPFPREAGQSRVATGRRIAKVAIEVLRHRATSTMHRPRGG